MYRLEMRISLPITRMVPIDQAALDIFRKKIIVPNCKVEEKFGLENKLSLQTIQNASVLYY